tara:strand:+ start:6637 stop:7233 length:597 start_codon:yes stop_codon:yes gene_type:complete
MTNLTIKGDLDPTIDIEKFKDIVANYKGENSFILDVLSKVKKYNTASAKQIAAVVKAYDRDVEYAKKNEERLARMVPIKDGKGEVIGEVVSIKSYPNEYDFGRSYIYKMLVEDFKGYRVFGTIPSFFLDEDIKVGDFVKFNAKLRQKELGFGFYSYPSKGVFVDGENAKIAKEANKPVEKAVDTKAEVTRELMDFLSA